MPINNSDKPASTMVNYVGLYQLALSLLQPLPAQEAAQAILDQAVMLSGAQAGAIVYGELLVISDVNLAVELDEAIAHASAAIVELPDDGVSADSGLLIGAIARDEGPPGVLVLMSNAGFTSDARATLHSALPLIGAGMAQACRTERLRADESSRDQMISLLVHDVRSPLVATHASFEVAQRLLRNSDVNPTVFEVLQTGLTSVRSAVDLCNDILEVKRLQAGYRIERRPVHIASLSEEVVRMLRSLAEPRGVVISQRIEPDDLLIDGDLRLMRRILVNLLSNALRFAPSSGGQIDIEAWAEDKTVRIQVSDNGPGVALIDRERIFQPFVQGNGEVGRGAGLGLAFCHGATLAHSGQIWVEDRPGGGCRFGLRLPGHAG